MAELVVVAYKGIRKAAEVLDDLQGMAEPDYSTMEVEDAAAVYRDVTGVLRLSTSIEPTKPEGAKLGAVLGALLGAVIAIPFAVGTSAAAAAALAAGVLGGSALGAGGGALTVE